MADLRSWVTRLVGWLVAGLVVLDLLDDVILGNRWTGCPKELFGILGAIVAGLFAAQAFGRSNGNGNGKTEGT